VTRAERPQWRTDRSEHKHAAFAQNGVMTDAMDPFVLCLKATRGRPLRRRCCVPSHEFAQAQHEAEGAWVHAWLHRIEGDLDNADYWYRCSSRPPCRDDTWDEGLEIARKLSRST